MRLRRFASFRRSNDRMASAHPARSLSIASTSERHLGPHGERVEPRARIAEIGGADLLANGAVKVVEHEPDVAIDVPVQRQRIDGLSPASHAFCGGEWIVEIEGAKSTATPP